MIFYKNKGDGIIFFLSLLYKSLASTVLLAKNNRK